MCVCVCTYILHRLYLFIFFLLKIWSTCVLSITQTHAYTHPLCSVHTPTLLAHSVLTRSQIQKLRSNTLHSLLQRATNARTRPEMMRCPGA